MDPLSLLSISLFLGTTGKFLLVELGSSCIQAPDLIGFPLQGVSAWTGRGFCLQPLELADGSAQGQAPSPSDHKTFSPVPRFHIGNCWWQLQVPVPILRGLQVQSFSHFPDSHGSRKPKGLAKKREGGSFISRELSILPPDYFMFNNHNPGSCNYLTSWQNFTKNNLEWQWPLWGMLQLDKIVQRNTSESKGSQTVKTEWDTYFNCYA